MISVGVVATLGVAVALLWLGARVLVAAAARLATAAGVSTLVVGLTVVAFGTSAPEFAVTLEAALAGRSAVSVGNVVGSNVFNIGVILGIAAVIRPFRVSESLVRRDAVVMGAATVLTLALLWNLTATRLDGVLLFGLLLVYLSGLLIAARRSSERPLADGTDSADGDAVGAPRDGPATATGDAATDSPAEAGSEAGSDPDGFGAASWLDAPRALVGVALVVVGGQLLVDSATTVARTAGVSEWVIGVTVVAAGTSLPELATSVVAARRGDVGIAAGNVVGSNVFNLLGVLGLAAAIRPLTVAPDALVGFAWLLVLTLLATALLATGRTLTRLEGAALIGLVAVYWVVSVLL